MSDHEGNPVGKTDVGIDIDALTQSINDNVDRSFQKNMKEFETNLESKIAPKKEDKYEHTYNFDDDDSDGFVTKEDLKKFGESVAERVKAETLRESELKYEEKSKKMNRDAMAMKDFALLNSESAEFNKDFSHAVKSEISRRIASGTSREHPDLIYDAAASIENQWIKQGKYLPRNLVKEHNDKQNLESSGTFGGRFSTGSKNSKPNANQIELAKRFNVDPKYVKNK